ncbi:kinase-like domain-containing protein [Lipomyces oligophaga]|uniref:kinase-like domain-containing protein n=1 Tax=Lipomyces oligophaga TaxID=45792 RepID=UPI0034CE61C5
MSEINKRQKNEYQARFRHNYRQNHSQSQHLQSSGNNSPQSGSLAGRIQERGSPSDLNSISNRIPVGSENLNRRSEQDFPVSKQYPNFQGPRPETKQSSKQQKQSSKRQHLPHGKESLWDRETKPTKWNRNHKTPVNRGKGKERRHSNFHQTEEWLSGSLPPIEGSSDNYHLHSRFRSPASATAAAAAPPPPPLSADNRIDPRFGQRRRPNDHQPNDARSYDLPSPSRESSEQSYRNMMYTNQDRTPYPPERPPYDYSFHRPDEHVYLRNEPQFESRPPESDLGSGYYDSVEYAYDHEYPDEQADRTYSQHYAYQQYSRRSYPPPSRQEYPVAQEEVYRDYHPPPPEATPLPPRRPPSFYEGKRAPRPNDDDYRDNSRPPNDSNPSKRRKTRFDQTQRNSRQWKSHKDDLHSPSSTLVPDEAEAADNRRNPLKEFMDVSVDAKKEAARPASKGFSFKMPSNKQESSHAGNAKKSAAFSRNKLNQRKRENHGEQLESTNADSTTTDSATNPNTQEQEVNRNADPEVLSNETYKSVDKRTPENRGIAEGRLGSVYDRIAQVGEGTYGKVYKAINFVTKERVALKRIRMEAERDGFPITALREIRLLQSVRHENVVSLLEMMVEKGTVYMVFEYMDHDLSGLLTHPQFVLKPSNLKDLLKQLLEGLAYLHKRGVLHRDIKGSNILISNDGLLKLADFGLARFYDKHKKTANYTNRVITLWYRPPELLLGATKYDAAVDVWGAGCLMVEMYTRRALFQGQDELQQLSIICRIMGTPTKETWPDVDKLPWYDLIELPESRESKFQTLVEKSLSEKGLKLASELLSLDPSKRPTAAEALESEYFKTEEPKPERPMGLAELGEWHEFESKQRRKKAQKGTEPTQAQTRKT